jgi:hypothetical protein
VRASTWVMMVANTICHAVRVIGNSGLVIRCSASVLVRPTESKCIKKPFIEENDTATKADPGSTGPRQWM